jgi:aryl-alcohol dehydrogenase-like predicted oxidoreductase
MKRRRLGRTGLEISEVGFGGAGIGGAYGASTDEDCVRAIRRAVELGIDFFDTSPVYGNTRSEERLGIALAGLRDTIVLATKVRFPEEADLDDMEAFMRRSLEASLRRLRTDRVDILQIHHQLGAVRGRYMFVADPPRFAPRLTAEDAARFAECARGLVQEGKVRVLGITAWDGDKETIRAVLESGAFGTAQILYNLVNHSAAGPPPENFDDFDQGEALLAAAANDIGVIGIRSHAAGALADRLDRAVKPESDVARDHARTAALSFLKKGPVRTLSAAALRFCLDHPAIATVVPGFKNAAEVEEAVAVAGMPPIAARDVAEIERLYRRQFRAT